MFTLCTSTSFIQTYVLFKGIETFLLKILMEKIRLSEKNPSFCLWDALNMFQDSMHTFQFNPRSGFPCPYSWGNKKEQSTIAMLHLLCIKECGVKIQQNCIFLSQKLKIFLPVANFSAWDLFSHSPSMLASSKTLFLHACWQPATYLIRCIQSNLALRTVKIRTNLGLRTKWLMTKFTELALRTVKIRITWL